MEDFTISLLIDCHHKKCEEYKHSSFLDDYSHIDKEFNYFHPKHDECCYDECKFCHEEYSVLDAMHENFDTNSNAHGFACAIGFLFGIR